MPEINSDLREALIDALREKEAVSHIFQNDTGADAVTIMETKFGTRVVLDYEHGDLV